MSATPPPDLETGSEFHPRHRHPRPEAWVAWLVLIVGILAMLANLGLISTALWRLWPLAIVAAGLIQISRGGYSDLIWGAALAIYGAGATLTTTQAWSVDFWEAWPIFIIAAGIVLMGGRRDQESWRRWCRQWGYQPPAGAAAGARRRAGAAWGGPQPKGGSEFAASGDETWLDVRTVFGQTRRQIKNQSFRGGVVNCVFSGCILDLRAMPAPDHPVTVHAEAVFGGIEIYLPPNWHVILEGHGIFGAFQDETLPIGAPGESRPALVVTGSAIFGAVTVK